MFVHDNKLFVSGWFGMAGGDSTTNFVTWDGAEWNPVEGYAHGSVSDGVIYNGDLHICGAIFTKRDTATRHGIMRYCPVTVCDTNISVQEIAMQAPEVSAYPNPFTHSATFEIKDAAVHEFEFTLCDALGRQVRKKHAASNTLTLYREDLESGIYFYTITAKDRAAARGKIVVE